MKIKNPWYNTVSSKEYFEEKNLVYQIGDYKIFKQFEMSFLYVYKDIAFNQLAGLNKDHIKNVKNRTRPEGKYNPSIFLYDQAIECLNKQA